MTPALVLSVLGLLGTILAGIASLLWKAAGMANDVKVLAKRGEKVDDLDRRQTASEHRIGLIEQQLATKQASDEMVAENVTEVRRTVDRLEVVVQEIRRDTLPPKGQRR